MNNWICSRTRKKVVGYRNVERIQAEVGTNQAVESEDEGN